jgi:hypothetical protein
MLYTSKKQKKKRRKSCHLKSSGLYTHEPARLRVLLETTRIVLNGLPFRIGEYEESRILEAIAVDEKMRVSLHAKQVTHSIVELNSASKQEAVEFLQDWCVPGGNCFDLQADFWVPKAKTAKYLGRYLVYVNRDFRYFYFYSLI